MCTAFGIVSNKKTPKLLYRISSIKHPPPNKHPFLIELLIRLVPDAPKIVNVEALTKMNQETPYAGGCKTYFWSER